MFHLNNRVELQRMLLSLDPATKPLWGKMNPQQMVEHLIEDVEYTNGKRTPTLDRTPEEAARHKQVMIYTDAQIPHNVILGELPEQFTYPNLHTAIAQLMVELAAFDAHFKTPGKTEIHGGFGPLDHNEWIIWHGKHFTHHLKQFGLLDQA